MDEEKFGAIASLNSNRQQLEKIKKDLEEKGSPKKEADLKPIAEEGGRKEIKKSVGAEINEDIIGQGNTEVGVAQEETGDIVDLDKFKKEKTWDLKERFNEGEIIRRADKMERERWSDEEIKDYKNFISEYKLGAIYENEKGEKIKIVGYFPQEKLVSLNIFEKDGKKRYAEEFDLGDFEIEIKSYKKIDREIENKEYGKKYKEKNLEDLKKEIEEIKNEEDLASYLQDLGEVKVISPDGTHYYFPAAIKEVEKYFAGDPEAKINLAVLREKIKEIKRTEKKPENLPEKAKNFVDRLKEMAFSRIEEIFKLEDLEKDIIEFLRKEDDYRDKLKLKNFEINIDGIKNKFGLSEKQTGELESYIRLASEEVNKKREAKMEELNKFSRDHREEIQRKIKERINKQLDKKELEKIEETVSPLLIDLIKNKIKDYKKTLIKRMEESDAWKNYRQETKDDIIATACKSITQEMIKKAGLKKKLKLGKTEIGQLVNYFEQLVGQR